MLFAAVLALRLVVPTGYMPLVAQGRIAIVECPGMATMPMATPDRHDAPGHHARAMEAPCAFAGLSAPALGGADAVLLLAALAVVAAAAITRVPPARPIRRRHLRPPLRAPPPHS